MWENPPPNMWKSNNKALSRHWHLAGLLVFLMGCSQGATKPSLAINTPPPAAQQVVAMPSIQQTEELLDITVLAEVPRANPFQSLLAETASTQTATSQEAQLPPPPPPSDPFEGVSLGGIIYKKDKPMAILILASGKSKIVHTGDVLDSGKEVPEGGASLVQFKVAGITAKNLTLQAVNPPNNLPPEMKTKGLEIKSLVGSPRKKIVSVASKSNSATSKTGTTNEDLPPEIKDLLDTPAVKPALSGTPDLSQASSSPTDKKSP